MTEPATKTEPPPPSPEEIAEAEETRVNNLAAGQLKAQASADTPLRMVDDVYIGIVGTARRYNAGDGTKEAVQSELDRVFGAGKVSADDVTTEPPQVEPPAAATASSKSK